MLEALQKCLPSQQLPPTTTLSSSSSSSEDFSPAHLVTATGADGVLVGDLIRLELPWEVWLCKANSDLLPRAATLNVVSKRQDLGDWDYPPLEEDAKANAAALAEVLQTLQ